MISVNDFEGITSVLEYVLHRAKVATGELALRVAICAELKPRQMSEGTTMPSLRLRMCCIVRKYNKQDNLNIFFYVKVLKCYSSTSHTGSTSGDGRVKRFAARKGKEYYNHTQCQGGSQ